MVNHAPHGDNGTEVRGVLKAHPGSRRAASGALREHVEQSGVNSRQQFRENTSPATTFKQQSEWWLEHVATRTRKPAKPATIAGWQHALKKWLLPHIGDKLLAEVSNGVLRDLVAKMTAAGLAAKSIVSYTQVVKLVVASAVTENGDQIHPRTWNHDFIGLPIVQKENQERQTVTETELEEILSAVKQKYGVLFALMAGTGLRIGEALGLKTSDLSPDCFTLQVRRSVWHGREQPPKTPNAIRVIDVPEALARVLRSYVTGRSGWVFATSKGRPYLDRNILRVLHSTGKKVGNHVFRRYRAAVLRKAQVPEDLIALWLGHSRTLTDRYASQLREDVHYRREWCERAKLGFSIVTLLHADVVAIRKERVA